MTIEDFEKEVKELFIRKGWDNKLINWFIIEITSIFKSKYITVQRNFDGFEFHGYGSSYEIAFADCLYKLESNFRKP